MLICNDREQMLNYKTVLKTGQLRPLLIKRADYNQKSKSIWITIRVKFLTAHCSV